MRSDLSKIAADIFCGKFRKISENFRKIEKLNFLTQFQIYEIIIYVILFVLFLALNKNKPHYNMLNSLGAMIFCFIKFSEIYLGKWLKSRKKKIRSYFRQTLPQYFFIKNIAFDCF